MRILVVEDGEDVRETIKMLLAFDHHEVETASSGSAALEMFRPRAYDLVITDHDMAGMKGTQLAAAIKAAAPEQPILMLTGYAENIQADRRILENLDCVLAKPCSLPMLREAIIVATSPRGPNAL